MARLRLAALSLCALASLLAAPAAVHAGFGDCFPLPASSVCARFYPSDQSVQLLNPAQACYADAEASLAGAPTIWTSLRNLAGPTCQADFAQLNCMLVYTPCMKLVSQELCQSVLGDAATSSAGACPAQVQAGFLGLVIPGFASAFNCSGAGQPGSPFAPEGPAPGQGTPGGFLVPQDSSLIVPAPRCEAIRNTSVCAGVIQYSVYVPWNLDQSFMEGQVAPALTTPPPAGSPSPGVACLSALRDFLCTSTYLQCDDQALPRTLQPILGATPSAAILPALAVPFPRLPCLSGCTQVNALCPGVIAATPSLQALATCNGTGLYSPAIPTCAGGVVPGTPGLNFPGPLQGNVSVLTVLNLAGGPPSGVPLMTQCTPRAAVVLPPSFALPPTSVCAGFYPPGSLVSTPSHACYEEAEASLGAAPTIWQSLSILTGAGSTCSSDFAQLNCLLTFLPLDRAVSRELCVSTLGEGSPASGGSCPVGVQQGFLALVIPGFSVPFQCDFYAYQPGPTGVGPLVPQSPQTLHVPAAACVPLSNSSVCHDVVDYPVYLPWTVYGQQSYLEAGIAAQLSAPAPDGVGAACLTALKTMLCSLTFNRCDDGALARSLLPFLPPQAPISSILPSLAIPYPRLPCRGVCEDVSLKCPAAFLSATPALAAVSNCDSVGAVLAPTLACGGVPVPGTARPNFPSPQQNNQSVLAMLTLAGFPQPVPLVSTCNPRVPPAVVQSFVLPASSVCAAFYPAGSRVTLPSHSCIEDAEATVSLSLTIWAALRILSPAPSTCSADFAQLNCLLTFLPVDRAVSREFCSATLSPSGTASCSPAAQAFLGLAVPGYASIFDCDTFYAFQPRPLGVGPLLPNVTQASVPAASCAPLKSTSVCHGVIDYDVYLPWQMRGDQDVIEAQIHTAFQSAFVIANPFNGCLLSLSRMLCASTFVRCDKTVLTTALAPYVANTPAAPIIAQLAIPFPSLPCTQLCRDVNAQCQLALAANPVLANFANCTGVGSIIPATATCGGKLVPGSAGSNFAASQTILGLLNVAGAPAPVALASTCNSFASSVLTVADAQTAFVCPGTLVRSSGPNDPNAILGGSCAPPCPLFVYSRSEWSDVDKVFCAIAGISLICSGMLFATYAIFPSRRKQTSTLSFTASTFFISLGFVIMCIDKNGRPSHIECKNDSETNTQADGGTCIFQAIFLFYFSLSGVLFWLVIALDLFAKIVMNRKFSSDQQRKLNIAYQVIGWGAPFILLIIALGLKAFGGQGGAPYCFFDINLQNKGYDWALFYFPVFLFVVSGILAMASIVFQMGKSARDTGATKKAGWWKAQIRPLLFIGVFIFLFVFIFAYRVHIWRKMNGYAHEGEVYVTCLIATLGDISVCGDRPNDTPSLSLFYMLLICAGGQGFFNALIHGTQWSNVILWKGLLTGKGTDWNGKDARGSTGSTGGSGTQSKPQFNTRASGASTRASNATRGTGSVNGGSQAEMLPATERASVAPVSAGSVVLHVPIPDPSPSLSPMESPSAASPQSSPQSSTEIELGALPPMSPMSQMALNEPEIESDATRI